MKVASLYFTTEKLVPKAGRSFQCDSGMTVSQYNGWTDFAFHIRTMHKAESQGRYALEFCNIDSGQSCLGAYNPSQDVNDIYSWII